METQRIPLKVTGARLIRVIRIFAKSEAGRTAKWMFAALVALLCAANGLNVANSYVNRNFMTAIADRNMAGFVRLATLSVGVYGASTVVAVIAKFAGGESETSDEQIFELLRALKVEAAVIQAGGLNADRDWNKVLSLRDQQLLAFARLFLASPRLVFLDRIGGALGPDLAAVIFAHDG